VDPFAGRSLTKFGVGEELDLGFTTNPARTAASFGGLNWGIKSGPATLVNNPGNGGTARVTMGETAGAVVLELRTVALAPDGAQRRRRHWKSHSRDEAVCVAARNATELEGSG
jgi:hypothetical protein